MGRLRRRFARAVVLFGAGAATMYFFDPDSGRSRRATTTDRLAGGARRRVRGTASQLEGTIRHAEGRIEGGISRATGGGRYHPGSDTDEREHLRQVIAELPFRTTDVNVDFVGGVATLRGEVEQADEIRRVLEAIGRVPGVDRVESFLHLPGTPAPNKEAAERAARAAGS